MKKILLLLIAVSISACSNVETKSTEIVKKTVNGEPEGPHTSTEWKIWAFSSAAPSLQKIVLLLTQMAKLF